MVITEPMNLSDVTLMLDSYKHELEHAGHSELALRLKGLELFDASGARVALSTLRSIPRVGQVADCVKEHLIQMLENLLRTQPLAA